MKRHSTVSWRKKWQMIASMAWRLCTVNLCSMTDETMTGVGSGYQLILNNL